MKELTCLDITQLEAELDYYATEFRKSRTHYFYFLLASIVIAWCMGVATVLITHPEICNLTC